MVRRILAGKSRKPARKCASNGDSGLVKHLLDEIVFLRGELVELRNVYSTITADIIANAALHCAPAPVLDSEKSSHVPFTTNTPEIQCVAEKTPLTSKRDLIESIHTDNGSDGEAFTPVRKGIKYQIPANTWGPELYNRYADLPIEVTQKGGDEHSHENAINISNVTV